MNIIKRMYIRNIIVRYHNETGSKLNIISQDFFRSNKTNLISLFFFKRKLKKILRKAKDDTGFETTGFKMKGIQLELSMTAKLLIFQASYFTPDRVGYPLIYRVYIRQEGLTNGGFLRRW